MTAEPNLIKFFTEISLWIVARLSAGTMESVEHLSALSLGMGTGFFASLVGWQINLIAIHRGIERNTRTAAFFVGMGAAFADVIFILIAMTGAVPFLRNPKSWMVIRWVGILTVFLLAAKILLKKPQLAIREKKKKRNPAKNFLVGFLIVITNPAVFLIWIGMMSFLLTHFPEMKGLIFYWIFLGGFVIGAALWFFILSFRILREARNWDDERLYFLSKLSAFILLIVGCFLIFERF